MKEWALERIRYLVQDDVGQRGLQADPEQNLVNAFPLDFSNACRSIAATRDPVLAIVTGFYIADARPPCGETDGPLGALFLARALAPLGIRVLLFSDAFCVPALEAGLKACALEQAVSVLTLDPSLEGMVKLAESLWGAGVNQHKMPSHLVAVERVGPSHTPQSVLAQSRSGADSVQRFRDKVPLSEHDRCHTMRGVDITQQTCPAHLLFEWGKRLSAALVTIGIGDGGNEIGMGKISWDIIERNIPRGGLIACRVPADHVIVAGISNWGAYGLAAGVRWLRAAPAAPELFDPDRERALLQVMVERGPLVDGTTGQATVTVDGLPFERYVEPLGHIGRVLPTA